MATGGDGANQNPHTSTPPPTWEGEGMFNIYIHDYCTKRGFEQTAKALLQEARLPPDSTPPINAKQGLLFEWWSVFWVLFQAKSNNQGPDDAMLYTQQQAQKQAQSRLPPQVPQTRMINGVVRPGGHSMPNGIIANGLPQQTLPNGTTASAFSGLPQANGNVAPGTTGAAPPTQPHHIPPLLAGQRPNGAAGPQTNSASAIGQMGASQPLTQMNARSGMPPPGGPQGSLAPGQVPQNMFPQIGRSPSQPGSPAQNGMMPSRSPSMAARQPPNMPGNAQQMQDVELHRFPPELLRMVKQEAGVGDRDLSILTPDEKQRVLNVARQRRHIPQGKQVMSGMPGPSNAGAGPSGSNQAMQPPRNPQMPQISQQAQAQQQQQQQQQQARGNKRSSTSPGQDQDIKSESSPPDRKRLRKSPGGEQPAMHSAAMPSLFPQQSPMPGGPGGPQMGNNMRPMPQFSQRPGMPMPPNVMMQMAPMGGPPMNSAMSPAMMSHQGPNGMMNSQLTQQTYSQSMLQMHKNNIPTGALSNLHQQGAAGSPSSSDGPGGVNRLQNKGMVGMMPPPPSPSMKNTPGQNKEGVSGDPSVPNSVRQDGSPQNAALGTGPSHPSVPGGPSAGPGTAPPTPGIANASITAPSPSAMHNATGTPSMPPNQPPIPPQPQQDPQDFFANEDFMTAGAMFEDPMFRGSEFDLADWFNVDNELRPE
ncbi:uncharacterized protein LAESUDRAFT_725118 [Laetiporus sulphureus 93-53]|uniref:Uncharacterized protein n=1 Tax=Laetiporus sulphureus 93-53 TaxID=1314785 RepID=A0A165EK15_9APHY|nr:uncharacterized protein LAESUDRAFT_725118 [Laetiporus sulphureus 93-53]KZT07215.1 hypothetical protein LAESUDRAFT_725118 [Laetiporus sulphureus 93-53]